MRTMGLLAVALLAGCNEYDVKPSDSPEVTPGGYEEGLIPAILVDPTSIDFGAVPVGDSDAWAIKVQNVGEAPLNVYEIALEDAAGVFSFGALDDSYLNPGDFGTLGVTFTPLSDASVTGTLTVHSDDPASPEVPVSLFGGGMVPRLVITPMLHDFGEIEVGETDQVVVQLRNDGDLDLEISSVEHATSSPGELFVTDWGELALGSATLAPGEEATVTVTYAPEDTLGPDEATLRVLSNDPVSPDLGAVQLGQGVITSVDYAVDISLTADDAFDLYVDGVSYPLPNSGTWSDYDTMSLTLSSGSHVIAVHAYDLAQVISGFIGMVDVDGASWTVTGDGTWLLVDVEPAAGWSDPKFDDSAWPTAIPCSAADITTWGTYWPADFYAAGAQWIWGHGCRDLGEGWIRYHLELP